MVRPGMFSRVLVEHDVDGVQRRRGSVPGRCSSSADPSATATETTAATRRPRLVTKVTWPTNIPAALITSASSARSSRTLTSSADAVSIHRWYPATLVYTKAQQAGPPG